MKEIDKLLKQWIPVNTIIREEIRKAIVNYVKLRVNEGECSICGTTAPKIQTEYEH